MVYIIALIFFNTSPHRSAIYSSQLAVTSLDSSYSLITMRWLKASWLNDTSITNSVLQASGDLRRFRVSWWSSVDSNEISGVANDWFEVFFLLWGVKVLHELWLRDLGVSLLTWKDHRVCWFGVHGGARFGRWSCDYWRIIIDVSKIAVVSGQSLWFVPRSWWAVFCKWVSSTTYSSEVRIPIPSLWAFLGLFISGMCRLFVLFGLDLLFSFIRGRLRWIFTL